MRATAMITGLALLLSACSSEQREAKKEVSYQLRDPSSAQFRNLRTVRQQDGTVAVCGEVNSKNAFGGYGGFQDFVVWEGAVAHIVKDMSEVDFTDLGPIGDQARAMIALSDYCVFAGRDSARAEARRDAIFTEMEARTTF